jgi:hypothetical protein
LADGDLEQIHGRILRGSSYGSVERARDYARGKGFEGQVQELVGNLMLRHQSMWNKQPYTLDMHYREP